MKLLVAPLLRLGLGGRGPHFKVHKHSWPSILIRYLIMLAIAHVVSGCGPGRGAGRRRGVPKLKPLVFKQHVPNISENGLGASGSTEGRIARDDPRFKDLMPNYNSDIIFKDEEGTGADRFMTQRCKERLNTLAISVMNQWPGVKLRVTEGWDEEGHHAAGSLHYEGRAVDVTTSDRDRSKYGMLAKLAVEAGFDWVYYESRSHIHCSVKSVGGRSIFLEDASREDIRAQAPLSKGYHRQLHLGSLHAVHQSFIHNSMRLNVQMRNFGPLPDHTSPLQCNKKSSQSVKSGGCFPGDAKVTTKSGERPMSSLRVGDEVLVVDPETGEFKYSEVLLFLDRNPFQYRDFVEIDTSSGRRLKVTPSHLIVAIKSSSKNKLDKNYDGDILRTSDIYENEVTSDKRDKVFAAPAETEIIFSSQVEIGDTLIAVDNNRIIQDKVVGVNSSVEKGVYAPLTAEGTVVVNEVITSCYAVVNSHSLAHFVYGPLRFYHNIEMSLKRLWESAFKPFLILKSNSHPRNNEIVGIHWYANILYTVAERILPSTMLYGN